MSASGSLRSTTEDRRHPKKRHRPVAAGELDPRLAASLGIGLALFGLALCIAVRPLVGLVGLAYLVLTISYTVILRHIVILDIGAIAGGFVLRAVAGGAAAPVTLSRWFVLVVTAAAVLVAAGKRYAELHRTTGAAARRRRVLELYTPQLLRLILGGSAAMAMFAYCVWAFQVPVVHGIPWRPLTAVPFAACLLRYGDLVRKGAGETPEELVMGDRWLAAGGLAWLVLFALSVHAGP
jgi:decaprenyl-phosphate phosphoribosyltransferase